MIILDVAAPTGSYFTSTVGEPLGNNGATKAALEAVAAPIVQPLPIVSFCLKYIVPSVLREVSPGGDIVIPDTVVEKLDATGGVAPVGEIASDEVPPREGCSEAVPKCLPFTVA